MKLYVFSISHYSEKARWALDHKGIAYDLEVLLPGPHRLTLRRLSDRSEVPVLVDESEVVQGSSQIIDSAERRWPEPRLGPKSQELEAEARELEPYLDAELGQTARRIFYWHMLDRPEVVVPLFTQAGPWWGPAFYRVGFRPIARAIRDMYDIRRETAEADKERFAAAVSRLEDRLKTRRYLLGDSFTRADITAAALTAPLFRPKEHSIAWQHVPAYPEAYERYRRQFAESPLREYVLRLYGEHRCERRTGPSSRQVNAA